MCGICGYVSKNEYTEQVISGMVSTLAHRGPDDSGIYLQKMRTGAWIGLGHRRLSILDLSQAGHQPMFSPDGTLGIIYNGEVYNYIELRNDLMHKGHVFVSNCDTEVVLHLFQEYGTDSFRMLNGMFALAIIDFENEEIILARDRIGKKPLYYYYSENNDSFVFGSELKSLIKFPEFHKEIRTELISSYLVNKCFASPHTIYKDTYKLEPGKYLVWKKGNVTIETYWSLLDQYSIYSKEPVWDYQEAKNELERLLLDAVSKRLIADVPVGTFLSGGIDSTVITALAQRAAGTPVRTYTIGFHTKSENEAEYAKAVARSLGTKHTEMYVEPKELLDQVMDLVYYYDEPFSDSSQIPSMLVSKLAREETPVILSGDGGDELFCGYETYDWLLWAQRLDLLGELGYKALNLSIINRFQIIDKLPDKLNAFINNRETSTKLQLFNDIREKHTRDMVIGDSQSSKYEYEESIHQILSLHDNWQMQKMLLDMRYYLCDEVLVKMDRASMRYSLEVRCPILDYRIIEYSFRIPHQFKYKSGKKKYILKDIAYDKVPQKLLDRPKMGFGVPLANWLREDLHEPLCRYADKEILRRQDIFNPEKVWEFINKMMYSDVSLYNSVLWGFLVFQMWYQKYIEDLW